MIKTQDMFSKKALLVFSSLAVMLFPASAQIQQGIVKTRGRVVDGHVVAGTRLPGATITMSLGNPQVSLAQGQFSFYVSDGKSFSLVSAVKQGYTLADPEITQRRFTYSATSPFYVVLEDEGLRLADIKAATDKVRRTLKRELRRREDELDELRERNAITQIKYDSLRAEFANYRRTSEALVNEMAERYASIDYDQLDEFNQKVHHFIEEGELFKADSLINTRGSIETRFARVKELESTNALREREIHRQQKMLEKSLRYTSRQKEDLASDLYAKHTISLQAFQQDSALYFLKMRADLDTTNLDAVYDYAYYAQNQNEFVESERYYKICLRAYLLDHDQYHTASIQNNLGNLYNFWNKFEDSVHYLQSALENRKRLFEQYPDMLREGELAATLNNLGLLYNSVQNYNDCEKYYLLALEHYDRLFEQDSERYRRGLSILLNNLGILYSSLGDMASSEKYFLMSLAHKEELTRLKPEVYRPEYAVTLDNLGVFYHFNDNYDKCKTYHLLALENEREMFAENPDAYRKELAATLNNLGSLYTELEDYENSELSLKEALMHNEYLFRQNNEAFRPVLARTLNNLGDLYSCKGDYVNSEKFLMQALEHREKLFMINPGAYRKSLAITQLDLGSMFVAAKDYTKADYYIALAYDNFSLLYQKNPRAYLYYLEEVNNAYALLYNSRGEDFLSKGLYDDAKKMWKNVLEHIPDFLKEHPEGTNLSNGLMKLGLL